MGSGSCRDVGGVGGSCREEIGGDGVDESRIKERIRHQDIQAEDIILGGEEGLRWMSG